MMLAYKDERGEEAAVMIDKIICFKRGVSEDVSIIHLTTGNILVSKDSVECLMNRVNEIREGEK